jgi:hypothetical protein
MTPSVLVLSALSDPTMRAVAEDDATERGNWSPTAWMIRMSVMPGRAYANADAYADADAYAYADADAGFLNLSGGQHMKEGLYVWSQPSGGVVVLRIGWIRRVEGDEYEAQHMVTPKRNGDYSVMLADLAIDGPTKKWDYTRPLPRPSPLNRFHIFGPVSLEPSQWSEICPKPKGWVSDE